MVFVTQFKPDTLESDTVNVNEFRGSIKKKERTDSGTRFLL